jgi:hypothetical protein
MLSVAEIVLMGMGAGLLAFMLVPCCVYWLNCFDVDRFRRADPPLQTQTII